MLDELMGVKNVWRRVLISLLVVLLVGGGYVWFSLSPDEQVNLEAAVDLAVLTERLQVARKAGLPVSLSGNEVKALAVKAIKTAQMDDRIKGIDVELGQNSMTMEMAVDLGAKVVAVSSEGRPHLEDGQLTLDLVGTKVGAVPVPVDQVLKRFSDALPTGVSYADGRLTIDLSQAAAGNWQLASLSIENGQLKLQQK